MTFIPVPGIGAGSFDPDANLANWIDANFLPGRLWDKTRDPEGLLSTLPAIGTCLLGVLAGLLIKDDRVTPTQKSLWLMGGGVAMVAAGYLWSLQFPIVKDIWTSSFVLVAGGYSAILLGAMYQAIDVWGWKVWATIFVWIGANAILIYFINGITGFEPFALRSNRHPGHGGLCCPFAGARTGYRARGLSVSQQGFSARLIASGSDFQLGYECAQRGDGRGRHAFARTRIFRGDIFNRHCESRRVGIDRNRVGVSGDVRVGPDLELSSVRPNARETQGCRYVDVGGKSARSFSRAAVEYFQRLFQAAHGNPSFAEKWCALEAGWRLACHHLDRVNGAFSCGADGIQAYQRARGHQNACTLLFGTFDQVAILQQLRDRERHEDAAFVDRRQGDFAKQRRRQTFNNNIAVICEVGHLADRNALADLGQCTAGFLGVANRDGSQTEARNSGDQASCDFETDSAETGNAHPQRLFGFRAAHFFRPEKLALRFSMNARTPST
jgi:hypothetical protein